MFHHQLRLVFQLNGLPTQEHHCYLSIWRTLVILGENVTWEMIDGGNTNGLGGSDQAGSDHDLI